MLFRLVQLVIGKMKKSKFQNLRLGRLKKTEKSETEKERKNFLNFQYQI